MSKFKTNTNSHFKLKRNVFFSNIYDAHKSYSVRDKLKFKILKHGVNICKIEKTEDELGPRMHGMSQRHHFHPDKFMERKFSSANSQAQQELIDQINTTDSTYSRNTTPGFNEPPANLPQ